MTDVVIFAGQNITVFYNGEPIYYGIVTEETP